jgi:hypothetical protein
MLSGDFEDECNEWRQCRFSTCVHGCTSTNEEELVGNANFCMKCLRQEDGEHELEIMRKSIALPLVQKGRGRRRALARARGSAGEVARVRTAAAEQEREDGEGGRVAEKRAARLRQRFGV